MPNVTSIKSQQFIFATDDDAVSVSAAATTLAILNGGPWANAQTITLKSSANNTGNTFTIVGTDADGDAQTATRAGPNAGSVDVSGTWKSVTSITASGAITTNISAGIKDGLTSGTFYAGRTRIRGMHIKPSGTAGLIDFKNTSSSGTKLLEIGVHTDQTPVDPYIPDDGVLFDAGAFINLGSTDLASNITVFYDG